MSDCEIYLDLIPSSNRLPVWERFKMLIKRRILFWELKKWPHRFGTADDRQDRSGVTTRNVKSKSNVRTSPEQAPSTTQTRLSATNVVITQQISPNEVTLQHVTTCLHPNIRHSQMAPRKGSKASFDRVPNNGTAFSAWEGKIRENKGSNYKHLVLLCALPFFVNPNVRDNLIWAGSGMRLK